MWYDAYIETSTTVESQDEISERWGSMTTKDVIGLVIVCVLAVLIIAASVVLLMGKGSWMIAGYNTSSKEEKEKTDSVALCKFMGKILLPIGALLPLIAVGGICGIDWLGWLYVVMLFALILFALNYANTKKRFQKK